MPTFLTYDQVAQRLHVPVTTVRFWVTAGKLPAFKPGRHPLIRESDVAAFVEGATVRPCSKRRGAR